ncbi:metallophosphoesterase [Niallia sp. 03190]|uniref:metallophosphoesterase n=1 Tax=Niallia sp. 03190 TaxID=3458061 RepID=UPI004043B62B
MSSFRFIVMGDRSSNNVNEFNALLANIKKLPVQPNYILFVGDLIYGQNVEAELQTWKGIVGNYFPLEKVLPAFGNHDKDETAFSKAFPHLPNEQLSGYQRTAYYVDIYNTRFIILNSNRKNSDGHYVVDTKQREWLETLLKNSNKTHHFVMVHVPPYPIGHHYQESLDAEPEERDALWSILDKYNVTATIVGHEHNYNRRLIDPSYSNNNGLYQNSIYQLLVGISGSNNNMTVIDKRNIVAGPIGEPSYLIVDVFDNAAICTVNDVHNKVIDYFIINRSYPTPSTLLDYIIEKDSTWKFLDDGSDQGVDWRNLLYDDSSWLSGPSTLGYGAGSVQTILSYGQDPYAKNITSYFRKTFTVEDPAAYQELTLRLMKDDGAIVYINGKEVLRSNMPNGSIDFKTLASTGLYDYNELILSETPISPSLLQKGMNIIAVEVHQVHPTSSDLSFNLELIGEKHPPKTQPLIPLKSVWKYKDEFTDQGTGWKSLSFNDSSWKSGPAKLGYGNGDEATVLNAGSASLQKPITYYFRKSFTVVDPSIFNRLILQLLYDDGAVVYLNGKEVFRTNLPDSNINYTTFASSPIAQNSGENMKKTVSPTFLIKGQNVIAVEVHQASLYSSDVSFELELIAWGK